MLKFYKALWLLSLLLTSTFCLDAQIYLELEAKTDLSFEEIVEQTEAFYDEIGREKGKGYKPFRRWQYEAQRSLDENGNIKSYAHDMKAYRQFKAKSPDLKSVSGNYTELGPTSAVNTVTWSSALGRFSALGLDHNDPTHLITGSPTGGIWRTRDGGQSWTPLYDHSLNIDIWALEISHSDRNHYFAGTGSEILYSTDAGYSWNAAVTGPSGQQVNTIVMDPSNASQLFATDRFGERIWRSTDAGINWSVVHTPGDDSYDIEFKPSNPSTMYASGRGFIAKSTDNGASWNNLTGPWLSDGVIMLAVTADDPNYVYALQEYQGGYHACFVSPDSGQSWFTQSDNSSGANNILTYDQSSTGGQAPRDMDICVSPDNKDEVYIAGTELWRSMDGGETFTKIADWLVDSPYPFIHADVDLLYYTDNGLYAGTDGGLFVTTDNAVSWTDWTSGTGVRQFYRIGVSATEVDRVSGGSQDNGTGILRNGVWYDWLGADGMETVIDWSDKDIVYGNLQFGSLWKTTDGGDSWASIGQTPGSGAWVSPLEMDPVDPLVLYHGVKEIYKTTNGGLNWSVFTSFGFSSNCTEIEVSPFDNDVIYASWGAVMYVTTDGGANWTEITPGGYINYIDSHPDDPDRVIIAQSGEIKESLDGGMSWTTITENLPNITFYCALYADDGNEGIFLGGRPGVWFKDNTTDGQWSDVSMNLPIVRVLELEIKHNSLYVATYGRGLWKAALGLLAGYDCQEAVEIAETGTYTAPGPTHGNGCEDCSGTAQHANWFKYTAPADGKVDIFSCNAGEDTNLFVYDGSCGSLNLLASSDDDCSVTYNSPNMWASFVDDLSVQAGQTIYIEWDDKWSDDSFFWTLEFCIEEYANANALSGILDYSEQYEADGLIESSQQVSGTGLEVKYDSKVSISLLPGFEIPTGIIFKAIIDGCGGPE